MARNAGMAATRPSLMAVRKTMSWRWRGLILFTLTVLVTFCDSHDPVSVSQMSPKSVHINDLLELDSDSLSTSESMPGRKDDDMSMEPHIRVERTALPIVNDISYKSSLDFDKLSDIDSNDVEISGRYFNYIRPTRIREDDVGVEESTVRQRTGKDLESSASSSEPFLSKGGPRSPMESGSPIKPSSVMQMSPAATAASPNHPRQNPNPDIQDIITGIVKLLNGNVNVHANTQAHRRPVASRINNRGPPRISEAQLLPNEFDYAPPGSSMRPPPYPFERPEGPIRPYVTGVPLPEQIVPSMQQNYRPSFVSQNRPPWHRPRPRPPMNSNRRPIPPYKPMPTPNDYHPEDEIQFTTVESPDNETVESYTSNSVPEEPVLGNKTMPDITSTSKPDEKGDSGTESPIPAKKDDHNKKKNDSKNKSSEKKPIIPITPTTTSTTMSIITIIESTSVVNTAQVISSTTPSSESTAIEELVTQKSDTSVILDSSHEEVEPSSIASSIETPTLQTTSTQQNDLSMTDIEFVTLPSTSKLVKTDKSSATDVHSYKDYPSQTETAVESTSVKPTTTTASGSSTPYHPRPGIVLDDPEFKPGGAVRPVQRPTRPQVQPTRPLPPGYGEIFDVTLSAIQGPGSGSGSKQTVKIKPFGSYGSSGSGDIIVSPSGDEGFVSIDGKRTYINLFGEATDEPPSVKPTTTKTTPKASTLAPGITGTGYAIPESETPIKPSKVAKPHLPATQTPSQRPLYRHRTTQPPVRIDTCIVGDDSTCDQAQNEKCKTENGVSSCHCRPGYSRRKHREPCRKVVSFFMSLRVDKIYERRIVWDKLLADRNSEPYGQLSYESVRAIDSAMSMTPFSDEFMEAKVNNIYHGDAISGEDGIFVNLTLKLEENAETLRSNMRSDIQKHLLGVIHRRNNNIGNSVLYVESPPGSISNLQDLDECRSSELNDCHPEAICTNIWGSFRCECEKGFRDPWSDQPQRAGRECHTCPETHCNNRGTCSYDAEGVQVCTCEGTYYGSQCEIDGEVLGVAIGASVAAVIIIVLTLVCLIMWSRRWHREQKNAMGSPVFGYMATAQSKSGMGQTPYQVTLEDRMRWAQIADVMAQANHYAAEPVGNRQSSAIFGYPNLQAMNMGTLGGMSMAGTLPMHAGTLPPVPLPRRLGISSRSNGMRTLENSSSSEEEDRTDLLGRNFQVPRPKSRSNGSIANQSGIYYDVDYEPAGPELYGTSTTSISNQIPGPQGIPLSTYTSGRAPSSYYMK